MIQATSSRIADASGFYAFVNSSNQESVGLAWELTELREHRAELLRYLEDRFEKAGVYAKSPDAPETIRELHQETEADIAIAKVQWEQGEEPFRKLVQRYYNYWSAAGKLADQSVREVTQGHQAREAFTGQKLDPPSIPWNEAVLGSTKIGWKDSVDNSVRWIDGIVYAGGKTGQEIAKEVTQLTGYKFDKDLLADPFAVPDKDGNYRFRIAVDSGDLIRQDQIARFGHGDTEASGLMIAVWDAISRNTKNGSRFNFNSETYEGQHVVRCKEFRPVRAVHSYDSWVYGDAYNDDDRLPYLVAAFFRNSKS